MSCLAVTLQQIGGDILTNVQRIGGDIKLEVSPICVNDIGVLFLYDSEGVELRDVDNVKLAALK